MIRRAIIIVLDSLGVGEMPDAAKYGDQGADTLGHILDHCPQLQIPNLQKMGMGNIKDAAGGRLKVAHPEGVYGRFMEHSTGKDTTTGHWEIAGLYTPKPFKTYPDGFPQELMEEFSRQTGRGWLGNCTASGTEIIKELGQEHEKTGKVIVSTSADSVFQVAFRWRSFTAYVRKRVGCFTVNMPAAESSQGLMCCSRTDREYGLLIVATTL